MKRCWLEPVAAAGRRAPNATAARRSWLSNTGFTRRASIRWLLCTSSAWLTACALPGRPPASDGARWSGRLALTVAATPTQASRGFSASFELLGRPERGQLTLSGPLGAQALRVSWSPGRHVLDDGQAPRVFDDLDSLVQAALGEPLPVLALFDWLKGQPWRATAHTPTPEGFEQLGWHLDTRQLADGALRIQRPANPAQPEAAALSLRIRIEPTP